MLFILVLFIVHNVPPKTDGESPLYKVWDSDLRANPGILFIDVSVVVIHAVNVNTFDGKC